ncbi:MAG: tRNA (adenosine(37)-N6)-threonylcarbamoyltransferase complex ATPase subunit type 1 TsaE [Candidatus Levyibacteriota bacterium]
MNQEFFSTSDEETQKLGEEFARELEPGDVVLLYGDLGYGKTTFVKGIAVGLGVKTRIISPTFPIVRTHNNMHHIDLYRIEGMKNLQEIGIQELLEDPNSIKLIEWPEKLKNLPEKRWEVKFEIEGEGRKILINRYL